MTRSVDQIIFRNKFPRKFEDFLHILFEVQWEFLAYR